MKYFYLIVLYILILNSFSNAAISVLYKRENERANLKTLQAVHTIFRHGDRNPVGTYPNDPYSDWSIYAIEGWGHLTKIGASQHRELGKFLRKRYDGFVSRKYQEHEIKVFSSDIERTISSAKNNLEGFYSHPLSNESASIKGSPFRIPIQIIPRNKDRILRMTESCPRYHQLRSHVRKNPTFVNLNQENKNIIQYISRKSGILNCSTVIELLSLYDILYCQKSHNLKFPNWMNETLLDKMKIWAKIDFYFATFTKEMKRLRGGPLINLVLKSMELTIKNETSQVKMFFYSGHDSTIAAVLNLFGVFEPQIPSYASAILLELHKSEVNNENYFLIFYKNETGRGPYGLKIPTCSKMCNFNQVKLLVNPYFTNDWAFECKSKTPWNSNIPAQTSFAGGCLIFILFITLALLLWMSILTFYQELKALQIVQ